MCSLESDQSAWTSRPGTACCAPNSHQRFDGASPDEHEPRGRFVRRPGTAEPRWPMAIAVLAAGVLRFTLPDRLRVSDAPWLLAVVIVVTLGALIVGDP